MSNTSSDACGVGYDLFYTHQGQISREKINAYLEKQDHQGISLRTYRHFQKLLRYRYDFYVPINQLDVDVARGRR
jgi:hypothetical protein